MDRDLYVVVDHGDGDVLDAYTDKAEAEKDAEALVDTYPHMQVHQTTLTHRAAASILAECVEDFVDAMGDELTTVTTFSELEQVTADYLKRRGAVDE